MNLTTSSIEIANRRLREGYRLVRASIHTEERQTTARTIQGGALAYREVRKPVIEDVFVPMIELSKEKGDKVDRIEFTTSSSRKRELQNKGYGLVAEAEDRHRYQKFEYDRGFFIVRSSPRTYSTDEQGFILAMPSGSNANSNAKKYFASYV